MHQTARPLNVARFHGVHDIVDFNARKRALLPQVVQGPSGGRRAKPEITRVQIAAGFAQNVNQIATGMESSPVQCGCPLLAARIHEIRIGCESEGRSSDLRESRREATTCDPEVSRGSGIHYQESLRTSGMSRDRYFELLKRA